MMMKSELAFLAKTAVSGRIEYSRMSIIRMPLPAKTAVSGIIEYLLHN